MQRKKKSGRDRTTYKNNVTASLRIMHKQQDVSALYKVGAAVATYAKDKAVSLIYRDSNTLCANPFYSNVEADSEEINTKLKALHTKLQYQRDLLNVVEEKISGLNKAKKPVSDYLINQRRATRKIMDDIRVEKVILIPELIREHANRRIDLAFLLMIAVYKTNMEVTKGSTIDQHGNGSKKTGTAACHSSLIPNPVFSDANGTFSGAISSLATTAGTVISYLYQPNLTTKTKAGPKAEDNLRNALNSTVELPEIVNKFDMLLEGTVKNPTTLVRKLLAIVNEVSRGQINPIQGIDQFGIATDAYYAGIIKDYSCDVLEHKPDTKNPKSLMQIMRNQREGTYRVYDPKYKRIDRNYIYMQLGIKQNLTYAQRLASTVYSGYIEGRILVIQQELLTPGGVQVPLEKDINNNNNLPKK